MKNFNTKKEIVIENNSSKDNTISNVNNDSTIPMEEEVEKFNTINLEPNFIPEKLSKTNSSSDLNYSVSTAYSNNTLSLEESNNSLNESNIKADSCSRDLLEEIYTNLILDEKTPNLRIKQDFMNRQKDINTQMRAILIDWLIEIHNCFHLKQKTLFQCIYIIDLYLSIKSILRIKLQLLGTTSLLISCKANEIYCPSLQQFIDITNGAYSKNEILKMEVDVLKTLNFQILFPTAEEFYNILSKVYNFNEIQTNLGNYFLDSSLIDYNLLKYKPSTIGVACAYIVMKFYGINGYKDLYSSKIISGDSPQKNIKECARDLCFLVKNLSNSNLRAAKTKYSSEEFYNVASICDEK